MLARVVLFAVAPFGSPTCALLERQFLAAYIQKQRDAVAAALARLDLSGG